MVTYRVLEAQAQSWPESYGAQHSWCQIDKPLIFCTKAEIEASLLALVFLQIYIRPL